MDFDAIESRNVHRIPRRFGVPRDVFVDLSVGKRPRLRVFVVELQVTAGHDLGARRLACQNLRICRTAQSPKLAVDEGAICVHSIDDL